MKILQVNIFKLSSKNLTSAQMIHLLETLSNLLKSGFTLLESFEFINLYFKYRDKELKNKIIASIKSGETCYEVLNLIGYPNSITTQIYFSQKYGNLEDALEESIKYLKTNLSAKQQVIKAVQYPLLLSCIFMCMIVVLNYTVIPQFEQLYISMDVNLSFYQKFLTSMITSFPAFIIFFITILILIFVILTIVLFRIETSKKIIILLAIPLFNSYYKIFKTYQISNDLSLFYKNGVSLQDIVTTYIKQ
ncbi:type II secretion system F family protein, partial [Staphylococcus haemolyticus]|uniref:type II secretion system F family protein n=1 Tax=Staphylococcus haemolyticus TaxID=1283 RepID=UPI000D1DEFD2